MNLTFNPKNSTQKNKFQKIKNLIKPLLLRKSNSKNIVNIKDDGVENYDIDSRSNNSLRKSSIKFHGLKYFIYKNKYFNSKKTNSQISHSDSENDSSIGTWISEGADESLLMDDNNILNSSINSKKNIIPISTSNSTIFNSNENLYSIDIFDAINSSPNRLINSNSSSTLYIKDLIENDPSNFNNNNDDNDNDSISETNTEISSISSSTPSTLSLRLDHYSSSLFKNKILKKEINDINTNAEAINKKDVDNSSLIKEDNNGSNQINIVLPPTPPLSPIIRTLSTTEENKEQIISTPPILSSLPREILIQIAMSLDFDTILSLRQTCRFYHTVLNDPINWKDYWKYTSDKVECLNSLVTNVYQGDEYIFGEILEPEHDKFISKIKKNSSCNNNKNNNNSSSSFQPNFIYKESENSTKEIPIEKILYIDSFSTRFGFSYLGGLRIYVPYNYGNHIVHFYDRPLEELPCSMEHYHLYEKVRLKHELFGSSSSQSQSEEIELPLSIKNCVSCADYYHKNKIDYTVTCTGRPISHISALWKYHISSNYIISFDITNSRSGYGYGYRNQDPFIHINYSFKINGKELSPNKTTLFRKYVLGTKF